MCCHIVPAEVQYAGTLPVSIPQTIEKAYRQGEIDYDTALLNKAYALFEPARVDPRFLRSPVRFGKCGTPVLREIHDNWSRTRPETKKILRQFLSGTVEKEYTYDSPAGYFKLHYDRTGRDGVPLADENQNDIPDYIEQAALYFDVVWQFEVDSLGYLPPPPDDGRLGDDRYDIVFEEMFYYGYTLIISEASRSSYITIENDFRGFPPNEDPEGHRWGALKVTAAHEFFHACQYVYDVGEAVWFMEVTAVWMEETAFDQVNDYYNYLPGFFAHPDEALDEGFPYEKVIWGLYLSQNHGRDIIRALWEECGAVPLDNALAAHEPILQQVDTTLRETFKGFTVWNYLTGERANGSHPQYEEGASYPQVEQCVLHSQYPVTERPGCPIDHLASCYISFTSFDPQYPLELTFNGQEELPWGAMLVLVEGSGPAARYTSDELTLDNGATGHYVLAEPGQYSRIILVPSLHSTLELHVPFTYSATLHQALTFDHTPLRDAQEIPGPYLVQVAITPSSLLDSSSVLLHYGFGTDAPISQTEQMSPLGQPNVYQAEIPPRPAGTIVNYYISAADSEGRVYSVPPGAPGHLYTFVIHPDTIPPMIVHTLPPWISPADFPLEMMAAVTDPYGLDVVHLIYKSGSPLVETTVIMTEHELLPDTYVGVIPRVFENGDTLFYRIEALDDSPQNNKARDPERGYHILDIGDAPTVEVDIDATAGWNMVSLPLLLEDTSVDALFPGHIGAFAWSGNGYYVTTDTMQVGYGYWVAFLEPQHVVLSGVPAMHFTRGIVEGWNMVGCGAYPTDVTALQDNPEGIVLLQTLSWYDPSTGAYVNPEMLVPGKGYWLASTEGGALTLREEMPGSKATEGFDETLPLATISLKQGTVTKILEFGCGVEATDLFDPYMDRPVPPPPPAQAPFDAYFTGTHEQYDRLGRDVRSFEPSPSWEFVLECESPVSIHWDVSAFHSDLNVILHVGSESIDMRTVDALIIESGGQYRITTRGKVDVPDGFRLLPNVPNPFNAVTDIRYQISDGKFPAHTTLTIFNGLGQKVRTLVDENQEPGYYTVTWNGRDDEDWPVSSGVYFVSLEIDRFTDIRKMVLLK